MKIFESLKNNKGTVSTELGKALAKEVLNGDLVILEEAVVLSTYQYEDPKEKNIRSGASKIVELVAMEKPELVAPYLEKLIPGLTVKELQTRWMTLRTFGLCAKFNESIAEKALGSAALCIQRKKAGQLCLVSSADLYLGDYGSLSRKNTEQVFALLLDSTKNYLLNEHDWLIEAFTKLIPYLNADEKAMVLEFAKQFKDHSRKATQKRVAMVEQLCK